MPVYEIKSGNVVRYLAKTPPAGHTWPVRGNLYRVRNVKEAKVALDPIDGNEGALRYAVWVPTESVEYVSNVDPFLKKNQKSEKEVEEPVKVKAKIPSSDLGELMAGIEWPRNEDGEYIPIGDSVFFAYGKDRISRKGALLGVGINKGESIVFVNYGRAFRCIPYRDLKTKPTSNSINTRIEKLCEQLTPDQQAELKKILKDSHRI